MDTPNENSKMSELLKSIKIENGEMSRNVEMYLKCLENLGVTINTDSLSADISQFPTETGFLGLLWDECKMLHNLINAFCVANNEFIKIVGR